MTVISGRYDGGRTVPSDIIIICNRQNDFCVKMGSGESHFDVSLIQLIVGWGVGWGLRIGGV